MHASNRGKGLIRASLLALSLLICSGAWLLTNAQDGDRPQKPTSNLPSSTVVPDAAFEEAHKQYLANEKLQFERPVAEAEATADDPPRSISLPRWLINFFAALGPVFQLIFYIGLAALAGTVLYYILVTVFDLRPSNLWKGKGKKSKSADDVLPPTLKPEASTAQSLLEEADALARKGKFSEAAHLLLFRSIEDIQTRQDQRLSTALTAREIGRLDALPAQPRHALDPIIKLVERSFFGEEQVDATGWQTARASYEDFAFKAAWR